MKKIDPEVREAIILGAKESRMEIPESQRVHVAELLCDRAEEILSRPKYSRLCEKVWKRLPAFLYTDALTGGVTVPYRDKTVSKDMLAKALEGIVELPEKVTMEMVEDYAHDKNPRVLDSFQVIFDNIRAGKYQ